MKYHSQLMISELINPIWSRNWKILNQHSRYFSAEDFFWGYRIYLEGVAERSLFQFIVLLVFMTGKLRNHAEILDWISITEQTLLTIHLVLGGLWLFISIVISFRVIGRLFDWAQLWSRAKWNKALISNTE